VTFPQEKIHLFDGDNGATVRNRTPPEVDDFGSLTGAGTETGAEIGAK
jgi:hypothetical protein